MPQPTTTAALLMEPKTEEDFESLRTGDSDQPDAQEWSVTITTTDGVERTGQVNRVGLVSFMLSGDPQGWLVLDVFGGGLEILAASKIIAITMDSVVEGDLDLAIKAHLQTQRASRR